jgi:hypothetical protein
MHGGVFPGWATGNAPQDEHRELEPGDQFPVARDSKKGQAAAAGELIARAATVYCSLTRMPPFYGDLRPIPNGLNGGRLAQE